MSSRVQVAHVLARLVMTRYGLTCKRSTYTDGGSHAWKAAMSRILYPTDEVAQQLGVGLTTAKALIKSGELRSVKIGRARRVPADALHEYVQRLDRDQNGETAA